MLTVAKTMTHSVSRAVRDACSTILVDFVVNKN